MSDRYIVTQMDHDHVSVFRVIDMHASRYRLPLVYETFRTWMCADVTARALNAHAKNDDGPSDDAGVADALARFSRRERR